MPQIVRTERPPEASVVSPRTVRPLVVITILNIPAHIGVEFACGRCLVVLHDLSFVPSAHRGDERNRRTDLAHAKDSDPLDMRATQFADRCHGAGRSIIPSSTNASNIPWVRNKVTKSVEVNIVVIWIAVTDEMKATPCLRP